jgi:shikimate kinase
MILKLKRTPGIYLVGFMGSGKTTVGRGLAWELGWTFADIDEEIETAQGISIAEIFDTYGEAEFRRIETETIRKHVKSVERGRPSVIALGGGAFAQDVNVSLLENNGISIWLDCPLDIVRARVKEAANRPLARDPEQLDLLYVERKPAYARSDYRIEVTGDDPTAVVTSILKLPIF